MKSSMNLPAFFRSNATQSRQNSSTKEDSVHTAGFQIIRQAVDVNERLLTGIQKASDDKSHYIFNHNEKNKRNDFKRRQRNLPLKSQYMKQFDESVRNIVKSQVSTDLIPTDPVILHSLPGCQPQAAHCDYLPDAALQAVSDAQMPLAILIALMPNTRLKVWPNSARLALKDPSQLTKVKAIECQEAQLNPGDMLVFRGDFVHAGSGYDADNYRIHYYLDSPLVPRTANRTWLIKDSGNSELCRIIRTEERPVSEEKEESGKLISTLFPAARLSYPLRSHQQDHAASMDVSADEPVAKRTRMSLS